MRHSSNAVSVIRVWVRVGKCSPIPAVMVAGAPGPGRQSAAPSQKSCADTPAEAATSRQHALNRFFMMRSMETQPAPGCEADAGRQEIETGVTITGRRLSGSEEFLKSSSGLHGHDSCPPVVIALTLGYSPGHGGLVC